MFPFTCYAQSEGGHDSDSGHEAVRGNWGGIDQPCLLYPHSGAQGKLLCMCRSMDAALKNF